MNFNKPSSVFFNNGGKGIVDVTGMSALDTLELLEHVDGLNCVTCDVDSVKASSVNTGAIEATTGKEDGTSVSSYSGGCSAGDTTSSCRFCSTGMVPTVDKTKKLKHEHKKIKFKQVKGKKTYQRNLSKISYSKYVM